MFARLTMVALVLIGVGTTCWAWDRFSIFKLAFRLRRSPAARPRLNVEPRSDLPVIQPFPWGAEATLRSRISPTELECIARFMLYITGILPHRHAHQHRKSAKRAARLQSRIMSRFSRRLRPLHAQIASMARHDTSGIVLNDLTMPSWLARHPKFTALCTMYNRVLAETHRYHCLHSVSGMIRPSRESLELLSENPPSPDLTERRKYELAGLTTEAMNTLFDLIILLTCTTNLKLTDAAQMRTEPLCRSFRTMLDYNFPLAQGEALDRAAIVRNRPSIIHNDAFFDYCLGNFRHLTVVAQSLGVHRDALDPDLQAFFRIMVILEGSLPKPATQFV
jgi:hypothetical protein